METIIRKIDKNNLDPEVIEEAGNILKNGGLVAFPTETVYGLGADALKEEAAKKTYAAKGRPSDNPLIVHIADYEDLKAVAVNIPAKTDALAAHFWPGPLTMIFEKSEIVPYGTTGGLDTVAVRMPSDPVAAAVIRAAGGFVSAPSANTSGRPSPTTAQHVSEDLDGKIDMILDSGSVDIGLESTILDMTVEPPMILRPGAITADMFEEVIGPVSVDETILGSESNKAPKAPGMKYRHYAPKAKLIIAEGDIREEVLAIRQLAYAAHRQGERVGIIATGETLPFYKYGIVKNIGTRENEKTIARNLYRVLREFDDEEVDIIYSESFAMQGIGSAIMNRLEKAAEQEYVVDCSGLVVLFPEPVNPKAEAIMKSAGMTLEGHVAKQFDSESLQPDTLILTVDESTKKKMISEYENTENVYTLSEFAGEGEEIPDPYGKPLTAYGECFEVLKRLIDQLEEKLNSFAKGEE